MNALSKICESANLIAQIKIALLINDNAHAMKCAERAEVHLHSIFEEMEKLPADWTEDSSLETWFPSSAKRLEELERCILMVTCWNCGGGMRCKDGALACTSCGST